MESLFPYRYNVVQIRVNDSWIEHAEKHAQKLKEFKGNVKASSWDVSQRIGEIALRYFLLKVGATEQIGGLDIGRRPALPTTKQDLVIAISCPPADERYNTGSNAGLRVFRKYAGEASLYVAALYDPPYIDFLGWVDVQTVLTHGEDQSGRVKIPATELRTMSELMKVLKGEE